MLKRILFGRKDVFGLDIGSCCVKAVQLQQDERGYNVMGVGLVEFGQDGLDSEVKTDSLIKAIRKCVKSAQIKTKYAVSGVCGPDVAARCFKFPPLRKEEIPRAILFEAEQVCPFDREQFVIDYQVVRSDSNNLKISAETRQKNETSGVLVAAAPDIIIRKTKLVRASSLTCVLVDADALALSNCLLGCEKFQPGETIAILDVGSKFTNLAVLHDNSLPFIRDIFHAADEIIGYIAAKHTLSPQTVRDMLYGRRNKKPRMPAIDNIGASLETACMKLITEVNETLRYYVTHEGSTINRILVCGGFALANSFIRILNKQLQPDVKLWNPFNILRYDSNTHGVEIIEEYGPSLALAAGLAMRTI